jgi:threonyl-tRNA synthetase
MSEAPDQRDHRRLGRAMDLFHFQEEAAGSVFWHPKGWTLFRTIESYIRARLDDEGYVEVRTPQLFSRDLWLKSGHWSKFGEHMFSTGDFVCLPGNSVDLEYAEATHVFKPMNCPAHVQIFNAGSVSYRDLPLRMAEFGCCHRNEPPGALNGIMRVRQFTQDDAHIFCTEDQILDETKRFCELLLSVYRDFGFSDVKIGFSTRPEKRAGDDATWDRAEAALVAAVKAAGLEYEVYPGEGAFYGPKLEFSLKDVLGREWQCGTLQLDFVLPERLAAHYTDQDGARKPPVMLHRAVFGSLERFIGILLEHYQGALPYWLRPVQATVVSIKPASAAYAASVAKALKPLRVAVDVRDENVSQKVKEALESGAPFVVAVGDREAANGAVSLRILGDDKSKVLPLGEAKAIMEGKCAVGT